MQDIPLGKIKDFQKDFLSHFNVVHKDIVESISSTRDFSDETREKIIEAANKFKETYI
jgi:F0F1-type ATP synthase alpha subunit